ncbi:MAG: hypothetical protein IPJ54_08630 [Saprospiraceae bacterium]|nr:hypothetical protein [Saprospiraceae bacterium]
MKVVIYTMQLSAALPPRIKLEKELLEIAGHQVEVCGSPYPKSAMKLSDKLFYYCTLSYFRWDLIRLYAKKNYNAEIAIVYDLSLLPLIKKIRPTYKRLVYETLDNNVALTFFHLKKKYPFIKPFEHWVRKWVSSYETNTIQKYTDHLLVNSQYLKEIFSKITACSVNIYASPFENFRKKQALGRGDKPALLYVGIFSEDKGASDVLELQKELDVPLYIFGDKKFTLPALKDVHWSDRMPLERLYDELLKLSLTYRFVGLSLIRSSNDSYANQEANKEADYLSLGIPFIGNQRRTTEEKIQAGVGCFLHEKNKIEQLIFDQRVYEEISSKALDYYTHNLSIAEFKARLLESLNLT